MKPYHQIECNNLPDIQSQVMDWINNNHPSLLHSDSLWNKICLLYTSDAADDA